MGESKPRCFIIVTDGCSLFSECAVHKAHDVTSSLYIHFVCFSLLSILIRTCVAWTSTGYKKSIKSY